MGQCQPAGATHIEHSHPNNFLSFVYYPRVPKGGDVIEFHDPRPQAHVIAPPFATLNAKVASTVTVAVEAGRLVAFPPGCATRSRSTRGRASG